MGHSRDPEARHVGRTASGRPQAPECAARPRAQRVLRCLTTRWGRLRGVSRGSAVPPSRCGLRRPIVPECTPRPSALGGYGFQGFPGYPTWGYLLTAVRVCTAEFGAHQEGLLGPCNGGGSPGLPYPVPR